MTTYTRALTICAASFVFHAVAQAANPTMEELWQVVQTQQQQLKTLQDELRKTQSALNAAVNKLDATASATQATTDKVESIDAKVEATADMIENTDPTSPVADSLATTNVPQSRDAVGSAAGRWGPISGRTRGAAGRWAERTTIGGYGELHYNNLNDDATRFDGDADDRNRVDFHRFVLFASHRFNDWLRFASEIEIEHALAGDGKPGEVEIELAWLEADLNARHHIRGGVDILPVGLLNLTHEPNTFYGVERNPVEAEIIPSTWWEASLAAWGEIAPGFAYNVYLHSGLVIPTRGGSAFRPRSGRLKVAEADDQDVAVLGRVVYNGTPGLEIAASIDYQADYTGTADNADVDAWLFATHIDWRHSSGLGLRALYARWDFSSDRDAGVVPDDVGANVLDGWYIEPAYRFASGAFIPGEIGVFMRYQQWQERNGLGGLAYRFEDYDMFNVGINYWPHPQVVVKFDAQWQDADGPVAVERDGINLGLGYQF